MADASNGLVILQEVINLTLNLSQLSDVKTLNTYTVDLTTTLQEGISIVELYVDYGDGNYVAEATATTGFDVTFGTAGTYTIKVKAIDNNSDEYVVTQSVTVTDMTMQETLDFMQNNPGDFGLVTQADSDIAVADGIETGKVYVQDNLVEFNLFSEADVDITVQMAIDICIADPASCNIKPNVVVIPMF